MSTNTDEAALAKMLELYEHDLVTTTQDWLAITKYWPKPLTAATLELSLDILEMEDQSDREALKWQQLWLPYVSPDGTQHAEPHGVCNYVPEPPKCPRCNRPDPIKLDNNRGYMCASSFICGHTWKDTP